MVNIVNNISYRRLFSLIRRMNFANVLALIIAIALAISGFATIFVLSNFRPLDSSLTTVITLLNFDLVLALVLGAILIRKIAQTWVGKKYSRAGSRLHIKMVVSFGLVAIIPALLVVLFLGLFLKFGIETWFNERVRTAVQASTIVAKSYLKEHQKNIRGIALSMANDLNRNAPRLRQNPELLEKIVVNLSNLRNLSEAVVVNSSGQTLARSQLSFSLGFNFSADKLLEGVLKSRPGEVIIIDIMSSIRFIILLIQSPA